MRILFVQEDQYSFIDDRVGQEGGILFFVVIIL
jgi:hypothetical protein